MIVRGLFYDNCVERYCYEIYLGSPELNPAIWRDFLLAVAKLHKTRTWRIIIRLQSGTLYYYLLSDLLLQPSLGVDGFLLKVIDESSLVTLAAFKPYFNHWPDNFAKLHTKFALHCYHLSQIQFEFWPALGRLVGCGKFQLEYSGTSHSATYRLALFNPAETLSVNFSTYCQFAYRKIPRYLSCAKLLPFLSQNETSSILTLDAFPVVSSPTFLKLNDYDFTKHSLILGGSGVGKSRFIASLIDKIFQLDPEKCQVVVIDPHDALKYDLASITNQTIIDFQSLAASIDLFGKFSHNIAVNVELVLDLFKSLLAEDYNSRLERVLRYSAHLLLTADNFSFRTLRQVLINAEYRQSLLMEFDSQLSNSITHFFLTDFHELKTQAYNVAFAPLIAFIDEMLMVPVFDSDKKLNNLASLLEQNFLSIFSLSRLQLGHRVTRTIAGLLFQQLFLFCEKRSSAQQLIIIIDEVAVIEHPILTRFLSELRKYQVTVILAGQYFDQITPELRAAILANTVNHYLFRVSKADATILARSLDLKPQGSTGNDPEKLLTDLKARECVIQVSHQGKIYPAVKAKTIEFMPPPFQSSSTPAAASSAIGSIIKNSIILEFDVDLDLDQLMRLTSTGRRPLGGVESAPTLEFPLLVNLRSNHD